MMKISSETAIFQDGGDVCVVAEEGEVPLLVEEDGRERRVDRVGIGEELRGRNIELQVASPFR